MAQPAFAFVADRTERPGVEIRVNFGVYAGREATAAEIEELARELHTRVEQFSIVAEQHYEFGIGEASVHLVRVGVDEADDELRGRLLEIAERWAQGCIAERHMEVAEI
ncbi:MAG TPA: hypothetical protein VGQ84_12930 [Gaiellaceae bacterium]|nr:hypothetical protein [Gaiellaceae bacterium]